VKRLPVTAALVLSASLAACGGTSERPRPAAHVRLSVDGPSDGAVVRGTVVEVRGTVRPSGAAVEIAGRPAEVRDGAFTAIVPLSTGANVIDVAASAHDARPAVAALRVQRDDRVTVPSLVGADPGVAQTRLEDIGLKVKLKRGGDFFDPIVPATPRVCSVKPVRGSRVARGTVVTVVWARLC
jgi:Glucodextranase, domain B/PASTA domain